MIAFGSNLGDREGNLRRAAEDLSRSRGVRWGSMSAIRETEPVGDPRDGPHGASLGGLGGPYLNAAAEVFSSLEPRDLLDVCLSIEKNLGRVRTGPNSPRTVDLDVLLFGDRIVDEPGLAIPHPRLLDRAFVLEPLAEIAPRRRHPVTGKTLAEHWNEWRARHDRR